MVVVLVCTHFCWMFKINWQLTVFFFLNCIFQKFCQTVQCNANQSSDDNNGNVIIVMTETTVTKAAHADISVTHSVASQQDITHEDRTDFHCVVMCYDGGVLKQKAYLFWRYYRMRGQNFLKKCLSLKDTTHWSVNQHCCVFSIELFSAVIIEFSMRSNVFWYFLESEEFKLCDSGTQGKGSFWLWILDSFLLTSDQKFWISGLSQRAPK